MESQQFSTTIPSGYLRAFVTSLRLIIDDPGCSCRIPQVLLLYSMTIYQLSGEAFAGSRVLTLLSNKKASMYV